MSNAQHTPGPWKFSRWDEHGDTRFYVSQQDGAPYTPNYSDVATVIAETCSGERVRIQEANARLIAAAPELFEALNMIHLSFGGGNVITFSDRDIEQIGAAIAKAKGDA
ncbi:hypothetical protein [Burkholderia multivorans]|uniref:hypothetical protein n=1 Tax=Burkholderia multivorans TaxID=87883 RepID=UPI0028571634|nr:hypothetical protein [Burkholderia multivorans]MDR8915832.1 hypothetical protein [Burkholderia multivorans]MDR8926430.1 hypothetical protein [Burkholderia multivorans]MDR8964015.1 hypothetical protein [Burkholderia multivorans]MDR8992386.1 hypothetical protein [Burkholderia multivorans]MDR9019203.1 hypothetical protein [Burkholderia multivorans]